MTNFLLSFGWNWLLVPVGIWFLNGARKALLKPRVRYLSHSDVSSRGSLVTVERQELLPPWRTLIETYLVRSGHYPVRESDGHICCNFDGDTDSLGRRLEGILQVAKFRQIETEELSK